MSKIFTTAVILAAGKGSRMQAVSLPKSLHPVAGKPLLARILTALKSINVDEVRVVIHEEYNHLIQPIADAFKAKIYFQDQNKKGTAVAVLSAQVENGHVLIINGDHPLINPVDLKNIIDKFQKESGDLCIGSYNKKEPGDYGRIVHQGHKVVAIIEKESLTHESKKITEVNAGIYLAKADYLNICLHQVDNNNPKEEYCLTDIVAIAVKQGKKVLTCPVSADSAFGANTQRELAFATKKIFVRKLNHLMNQGVIVIDPLNTYVEEMAHVGQGSVLYPGVYLKGRTNIGPFCAIETNCFIMDSVIHEFVLIRSGSYLESAEVGQRSSIGPYARLRPGTKIGKQCKVGNFVEMKKTEFGNRSKASHLSYLGDAEVGEDVNIGCGTVTCNLNINGKKYPTRIGDKAFVGSGTQIVAPVELGDCSATGAGSVITENIPSNALGIERTTQKNLTNHFNKQHNSNNKKQ